MARSVFYLVLTFILFSLQVRSQNRTASTIADSIELLSEGGDSVLLEKLMSQAQEKFAKEDIEDDLGYLAKIMGNYYSKDFQYDSAQKYYQYATDFYENTTDTLKLADAYYKLGGLYTDIEDYTYSAETFLKALKLYQAKDSIYYVGKALNAIGNNYYYYGDSHTAIDYYNDAIEIFTKTDDAKDISMSLGNAGAVFTILKEYDTARAIYERAIDLVKYTSESRVLIGNLIGLGVVEEETGNFDKAYRLYKRAFLEAIRIDDKPQIGFSYSNFSYYFLSTGQLDSAEYYALQSLEFNKKMGSNHLLENSLEVLHEVYYQKGDYKTAYDYLLESKTLSDSVYNLTSQRQLEAVNAKYRTAARESELSKTNFELQLKENTLQREIIVRNALIAVLFLMIVVAALAYRGQKLRSRSNDLLRQKNLEIEKKSKEIIEIENAKSRWFINISHELRTPLTLVKGPIEQITRQAKLDTAAQKSIQIARRNIKQLESLVNEILDLSKIEQGNVQLENEVVDISELAEQSIVAFETAASMASIKLKFDYPLGEPLFVSLDHNKIAKVVTNLISNALKFTSENGSVTIRLVENAKNIILEVKDTGEGISPEELPYVFDRFYQAKTHQKTKVPGSGVGLALSKEIAQLHGGDILVESKTGEGSTFSLIIPADRKITDVGRIEQELVDKKYDEESLEEIAALEKSDRTIMVVEDNFDMREYIINILNPFFNVMQARDGKEALEIIQHHKKPDLIVSDIMMPRMDGHAFARALKEDESTRYIPFITLTALSDEKSRMESFRIGIDDFLIKPFNSEELLVRIQNLIHNAEERVGDLEKEAEIIVSHDDKVIRQLELEVIENISDSELSVGKLAEAVGMSERKLYRFLKQKTGLTPANFMKEIRLRNALEMAQNKVFSTAGDLAMAVGFPNAGYFNSVFKKRYGKSPSSYLRDS